MAMNPGSPEAVENGCTCAVLDNNHGKFPPFGDDWWITEGCPLHFGGWARINKYDTIIGKGS